MEMYHEIDEQGNFIPSGTIVIITEEDKKALTANHVPAWEGAKSFYKPKYNKESKSWYESRPEAEIVAEREAIEKEQSEAKSPQAEIERLKTELKSTQEIVNMMMFEGMML